MSIFICEKCGKLDNTACNNNYWRAFANKHRQGKGDELDIFCKPQFDYFETNVCCSDCCDRIVYRDDSGIIKKDWIERHWSKFGKETLLEWESRGDGSMVNATEYFENMKDEYHQIILKFKLLKNQYNIFNTYLVAGEEKVPYGEMRHLREVRNRTGNTNQINPKAREF